MEKGLSLWYAQKKMCDPICSNINFQIRHFSLCIHTRLHRKTNKSLIPWNKLTFPLPTANEKKSSEENKTESVREIYSTFLFSLKHLVRFFLDFFSFSRFSWKTLSAIVCGTHSELEKKKEIYCRFSFSCSTKIPFFFFFLFIFDFQPLCHFLAAVFHSWHFKSLPPLLLRSRRC